MEEPKTKRTLPPKARDYLDLIKICSKEGFKPLSKAMKEAGRRWRVLKGGPKT